jgi:hypothetical protein
MFARFFGMELAQPRHLSLARVMSDKGPVWERIVQNHRLQPHRYDSIAAWPFADYVFGTDYDVISDMGKARRLGFSDSVDSEEMFLRLLTQLREQRIIP